MLSTRTNFVSPFPLRKSGETTHAATASSSTPKNCFTRFSHGPDFGSSGEVPKGFRYLPISGTVANV